MGNNAKRQDRRRERAEARVMMPLAVKRSKRGKAQIEAMKVCVCGVCHLAGHIAHYVFRD
jgi:hypothetical protein